MASSHMLFSPLPVRAPAVGLALSGWPPSCGQDCARYNTPHAPSVASTMTPALDDFVHSPPVSPELARTPTDGIDGGRDIQSPVRRPAPTPPPRNQDAGATQGRKVFVGGIPKSVDQYQLKEFFNAFGKVQKAWLQYVRGHQGPHQKPTHTDHRGFGFVVFYEQSSVETMLGGECSRYIDFGDGTGHKVEVKRAVPNSDMEFVTSTKSGDSRIKDAAPPAGQLRYPDTLTRGRRVRNAVAGAESPKVRSHDNDACEIRAARGRGISDAMADGRNEIRGGVTGSRDCSDPPVPLMPFDGAGETVTGCGARSLDRNCSNIMRIPSPPQATHSFNAGGISTVDPCHLMDILLRGFAGQRPCNSTELALLLAEATPDLYDD